MASVASFGLTRLNGFNGLKRLKQLNVLYMCLLPTFGLKWLVIDQRIYKLLASWHWFVASATVWPVWPAILGKTSFEVRLFADAKHHPRQHPVAIMCHVRIIHQVQMHAIVVKNDLPPVVVDHNNAVHCHHDAGMLGCWDAGMLGCWFDNNEQSHQHTLHHTHYNIVGSKIVFVG